MTPDSSKLSIALDSIFSGNGSSRRHLLGVRREPTAYVTTFPCEILTCRFGDGSRARLFCKYATKDGTSSFGQRGGVGYEAEVYRRVLQHSGFSTPVFYGSYRDETTGDTWLIVEYLRKSLRAGKVSGLRAMMLSARWIGEFHAANETHVAHESMSFLTRYDSAYYRGWPRRAFRLASQLGIQFLWLEALCRRLRKEIPKLAELPQTVIHGEYYPHNILFQAGVVRPVDWETAAIAPGEIDLATLTEGWDAQVSRKLESEYQRARWPKGAPADFQRNLDLARLYMQTRWLGDDDPKWTGNMTRWRRLYAASKRLQFI